MAYYSEKYAKKQKVDREVMIQRAKDLIKHPKKYDKVTSAGSAAYVLNISFSKDTGEIVEGKALELDLEKIKEEEFVWTNEHIDAHFTTCFTALILIRLLQPKLDNKYPVGRMIKSLKDFCCVPLDTNNYQFTIFILSTKKFSLRYTEKSAQLSIYKGYADFASKLEILIT